MSDLPDYLRQLEDRLDAWSTGERVLMLSQVDGFVTGIALSPSLPDPEAWLAALLDAPESDGAADVDAELADLILDHWETVVQDLEDGTFRPILDQDREGRVLWQLWVLGFATSLQLDEGWDEIEDEEVREPLDVLLGLALTAAEQAAGGRTIDPERDSGLADVIPELVQSINDGLYDDATDESWDFDGAFPAPQEHVPLRTGPKTGRNDPCPCGSGKKYKKCCGA